MTMKNRDRISDIHSSDLFGILIESGCAGALSHALQSVEGASKTVYMAETPYSKEYQHLIYRNENLRSIGKETAELFANPWIRKCLLKVHKGINFIYTSTFQIAEYGSNKSTHGWIVYVDLRTMRRKTFHVSMKTWEREDVLGEIESIGLDILEGKIPKYTDIMEESNLIATNVGTFRFEDRVDMTASLLQELEHRVEFEETSYICVSASGRTVRIEDIIRDKEKILIYKGSFNPPHNVHLKFAQLAEKLYGIRPIFSISMDTFGKGHVNGADVLSRVKIINSLGYDVIIVKDAFFSTMYRHVSEKVSAPIVFLLGSDTFNRLITSSHTKVEHFAESFPNVKFMVLIRPENPLLPESADFISYMQIIDDEGSESSTHIRKLIEENNMEEVRKLVPENVYKIIKEK